MKATYKGTGSVSKALEQQADDILKLAGFPRVTREAIERQVRRHYEILSKNSRDERILLLHGADGFLERTKNSETPERMRQSSGTIVGCSSTPEDLLFEARASEAFSAAVKHLFDEIFKDDQIVKILLATIILPPHIDFKKTSEISKHTGLSVPMINAAKSRIRYKLKARNFSSVSDLIEAVYKES